MSWLIAQGKTIDSEKCIIQRYLKTEKLEIEDNKKLRQ